MIHPYFFIHIPKNAGMTIRHSPQLKPKILTAIPQYHVSEDYTKRLHQTMQEHGDHHGNEHARYKDIKESMRKAYKFFAVLRNPWSRTFSRYMFAKKVIQVEKKVPKDYADVSSFDAFLEERYKWGKKEFFWHRAVRGWFDQADYVLDESGRLKVDCLKFENIELELSKYFGIDFKSRRRNVTAMMGMDETYKEHYTPEQIQIVGDWYEKDIEMFGFDFNTSAKRNTKFEGHYLT